MLAIYTILGFGRLSPSSPMILLAIRFATAHDDEMIGSVVMTLDRRAWRFSQNE